MSAAVFSSVLFAALPIAAGTRRALTETFGFDRLTRSQAACVPALLHPQSPDVFVQAGTGTGKTVMYLIAVVQRLLEPPARAPQGTRSVQGVGALVLSPTRELAGQTAQAAAKFLTFHPGLRAGVVTGGTDRERDVRLLSGAAAPALLIATPGRLEDLLRELPSLLARVRIVVLDEADSLLAPGFEQAVIAILAGVAAKPRSGHHHRTLLFTATVPPGVLRVAERHMRPGWIFVDAGGPPPRISESAVVCPPRDMHVQLALALAARESRGKALVFFGSNALIALFAELFRTVRNAAWAGGPIEYHSGLAQARRTEAMERFRATPGAVMFASDAAGLGIDVPDVALVVQVGCATPVVYRQRLGRTGRMSASGAGLLILGEDEEARLPALGIPADRVRRAPPAARDLRAALAIPPSLQAAAHKAFRGILGAMNNAGRRLPPQAVVDGAAARLLGMGMSSIPQVPAATLAKMGLRGVSLDAAGINSRLRWEAATKGPGR